MADENHSDAPGAAGVPGDPSADHSATARGRAFLIGGALLGVLLIVLLYTHGLGLWADRGEAPEPLLLEHRGAALYVPEGSALRQRLSVEPAAAVAVSGRLLVPGSVESDPARTAPVLSPLGGRVAAIKVHIGERVQAGQVLALIDSPDLAQAYADFRKAADTLRLAGKNLERQQGQAKIGALSERDLDQARSDHNQARAEYQRTVARLKAIDAPLEPQAATRLLTVRAPFSGSVTTLGMATGNMINDPTQPILTLVHLGTVWVTGLVAEKDVPQVSVGQEAEVTLAAAPGRVLRGKVLYVGDVLESDSHRAKVRIAFDNPDATLKPNMYASVTLLGAAHEEVVVPTSALLMNNDRTSVFVATAPWTFVRRMVEPDLQEGDRVPILSGLRGGEQVVVKGGILLND